MRLPQLCMCHSAPPLSAEYPYLCAANCALHRNPAAHEALLKSLLAAYGIQGPDAGLGGTAAAAQPGPGSARPRTASPRR